MPEKDFKPLTNIEHQRLLMANFVLAARGSEPSESLYTLINALYSARDELGLVFPEGFIIRVLSEKNLKTDLESRDESTINSLRKKIETVNKTIAARLIATNIYIEGPPKKELEKTALENNVGYLSSALQFNEIQSKLLMFFACSAKGRFEQILKAAHTDDVISHEDYIDSLAILLNVKDKAALKAELELDSILVGVRFLAYNEKTHDYTVDAPLQRILIKSYKSPDDLLTNMLGPSPTTELQVGDYTYMGDELSALTSTLTGFLESGQSHLHRKNMVIGGPPGTGKTELTAILAKELKARAFMVGVAEKSEATGFSLHEPTRDERINALVRCAFVLRQTRMRAFLVFDEAEDVLRDLNSEHTKELGSKAFINELLEHLGAATIFISNRTDLFDPATIRRILPYYSMNYMPFSARVATISTKATKYVGITLTADDVRPLSKLASNLSVAVIDSCISVTALRLPKDSNKELIIREIEQEFLRALKAQNKGLPTLPVSKDNPLNGFDPRLISASDQALALIPIIRKNTSGLAGTDFTIIGSPGTGRKSVARFLATRTGIEPKVIQLNYGMLGMDPDNAHALDLERAALDNTPIIFDGALRFLSESNGHPLLERIKSHPLPTFFISDFPQGEPLELLDKALSHLTFVIRTGNLSPEQLRHACKELFRFEVCPDELNAIKDLSIGSLMVVRRQMESTGEIGDKEMGLQRMLEISMRLNDFNRGTIGFAGRVQKTPLAIAKLA